MNPTTTYVSLMAGVLFLTDALYLAFVWFLFNILSREIAWLALLGISCGLQLFNTYLSGLSIWDVSHLLHDQAKTPNSSWYMDHVSLNLICGLSAMAGYYIGNRCFKQLARSELSAWQIFRGCPKALRVAWGCDRAANERFERFQRLHRRKERLSSAQETEFTFDSFEKTLIPDGVGTPQAQLYQQIICPTGLAAAVLPLLPKVVMDFLAVVLHVIPGSNITDSSIWMLFWAVGMGFVIPLTFWSWVAVLNLHNTLFDEATLDRLEVV